MGVILIVMMGVVSLNIVAAAALLTKYAVEQHRKRHELDDLQLASVIESWQQELTHH